MIAKSLWMNRPSQDDEWSNVEVDDPVEAAELEAIPVLATGDSLESALQNPEASSNYMQESITAYLSIGK